MSTTAAFILAAAALAGLAAAPLFLNAYGIGLLVGMTGYVVLASAWAMFSGPTRYISLATVAFFGIGAYTVAVLSETLPYPLVLLSAAAILPLVAAMPLGNYLARFIAKETFDRLILVLLALIALRLVLSVAL